MSQLIIPDLVIGGAPKCGTTSLFSWLSESSEITPSNTKETNFLVDQNSWLHSTASYSHTGESGYSQFFKSPQNNKILMEGCAVYLYMDTAIEVLKKNNKTKIIFILRNPSERIISNYNYFFKVNSSSDISLEYYIESLLKKSIESSNEQISSALNHGIYHPYIKKWINALGRDRVKIITLEQMKEHPHKTISEICSWIGINEDFISNLKFTADNQSYTVKLEPIHRAAKILSKLIPEGKIRNKIKNKYISINGKKPESKSEQISKLISYYRPSIENLETLLEINLEAWKSDAKS